MNLVQPLYNRNYMNNKTKAAKDVIYCLVNTYMCMTADIIWMITLYIMWMILNNGNRCPGRTTVFLTVVPTM